MKYKFFKVDIQKDADEKEEDRTITAIGATSDVDRDRDIIDIKGMDIKSYKNNPIILWSHNAALPPIGKALSVTKGDQGLKFKIEFAGPDINPQADTIFKLYKAGFLNAFSVGFVPDWEKASYNEKRGGFDFPKTELLELSAVNVHANQNALIQRSITEGVIDEIEAKDIQMYWAKTKMEESDVYTKEEMDVIIKDILKRFETHPPVEIPKEGELHIVDQALQELFESSDDKSGDDSVKDDDDDLNSLLNEVLDNG